MLLTISNSEPVSTGCLLLTVCIVFLLTITLLLKIHMLIHTSQSQRSSHKDQRIATVKERFYVKKRNLQSNVTKINVKERKQQMYA